MQKFIYINYGGVIMGLTDGGYSLADIKAVTDNDKDGMFGGNWWWIILFFFFMWGNGGMWGNNGNALNQAELQRGFDTQNIIGKLDGISRGICDLGYENAQLTYGLTSNMNAGFANVNNQFANVSNQLNTLGYNMQQCCCSIERNNDRNTQLILDKLCDNEIQTLRDNLQTANLTIANQVLANNIVNQVRPVPQPAYITCSPYAAATNTCGYNCSNYGCAC